MKTVVSATGVGVLWKMLYMAVQMRQQLDMYSEANKYLIPSSIMKIGYY